MDRSSSIAASGFGPGNRSAQKSGETIVLGREVGSQSIEGGGWRGPTVAAIGDRKRGCRRVRWEPEPFEHPVAGAFGVLEMIFGEEDQHSFGSEGLEPSLELLRVSTAGQIREVLMRSRDGGRIIEKASRLTGESGGFLCDRILELKRLDAEPSFMSMMRPGPQGGVPEQHDEIEFRTQQITGDRRRSRVEEVVGARVPGSASATEPALETGASESGLLEAPAAKARRPGAREDPAFLGRPREYVW